MSTLNQPDQVSRSLPAYVGENDFTILNRMVLVLMIFPGAWVTAKDLWTKPAPDSFDGFTCFWLGACLLYFGARAAVLLFWETIGEPRNVTWKPVSIVTDREGRQVFVGEPNEAAQFMVEKSGQIFQCNTFFVRSPNTQASEAR